MIFPTTIRTSTDIKMPTNTDGRPLIKGVILSQNHEHVHPTHFKNRSAAAPCSHQLVFSKKSHRFCLRLAFATRYAIQGEVDDEKLPVHARLGFAGKILPNARQPR